MFEINLPYKDKNISKQYKFANEHRKMMIRYISIFLVYSKTMFCSIVPQTYSEIARKYNIRLETLDHDIENFRKSLHDIIFDKKSMKRIDCIRINTHVSKLCKPFIAKIELFYEIKKNVEKEIFINVLKHDKICVTADKVKYIDSLDTALQNIHISKVVVNINKGVEKNCTHFEKYKNDLKKILGKENCFPSKLLEYRKNTYAMYNHTGSLKIYFGTDGVEQLCSKQINDFTIGLNMSITNSFE
ncbi:hypothetical protein COBT_001951 [Conglomerata obtusa]